MKHVLFGAKAVFVDDEAADVLIEFGAHIAQLRSGARVELRGYSAGGNEIVTTLLLNSGSNLVAETASAHMEEPDNTPAVDYMRERMAAFSLDAGFFSGFRIEESDQT